MLALLRSLLLAVVFLWLSFPNGSAADTHPRLAGRSTLAHMQSGTECLYNDRRVPNGTTVACIVQPRPNTPCHTLLGTVVLWTCRNGQWFMK